MLYEERIGQFRWQIPEEFNFAWDVIDAYAEDRSRLALVWENEAGDEARFTFWDFAERYGISNDELITRMDGGP